ncbi:hypothetical protein OIU76_007390 [Salix suchowensis]|nr:hypothetical protein OIU76_007390 [Salix suchowensis]
MKASLSGNALSDWDATGGKSYCNFTGVSCNSRGYVEVVDISGWSTSGRFPSGICSYLPGLRVLRLGDNTLHGDFLHSIVNCSFLEELNLSFLYATGTYPDFSPMKSLRILDVSYNHFTGEFPMSVTNLSNLEVLNFNENDHLDSWQLPENISRLTKLKRMILTTCVLYELGSLKNLQQLELYYNYHLSGYIPEEFGNLTELLYNNSLTGEIPSAIASSKTLRILSLYDNFLTGEVPRDLGHLSAIVVVDLSENRLSGPLPTDVCRGGNKLNSSIPKSLSLLRSLNVLDLSNNLLTGSIPESLCELLPNSINFSNNLLSGPIPLSLIKGGLVESFSGNPGLCVPVYVDSSDQSFPVCPRIYNRKRLNSIWAIGISVAVLTVGALLFLKRQFSKDRAVMQHDETMSSSFISYDLRIMIVILNLPEKEYAYTSKATTKCDVYSFGVVLMELITGKKPVEADFGESKNIIYLVSTKVETKEGVMEVLDKRLSGSFRDEMIQVLRIAIRCTYKNPALRPTMNEVVQLLIEAGQNIVESTKSKEASDTTKIKNQFEL